MQECNNMSTRVTHLLDAALGLPSDERSALTVALLDSLHDDDNGKLAAAWRAEIERRRTELRAGQVRPTPWAEAKVRLSQL